MISIRKAADELERMESLLRIVGESYGHALLSAGQYAVELDPAEARVFRQRLAALRTRADSASGVEDWRTLQASFRGELREYRDKCGIQLKHLREEIKATVDAMQLFADTVATSGADHEKELKQTLVALEKTLIDDDLDRIRSELRVSIQAIAGSVERMQRAHQIVIAQLRDEIRLLHRQIDTQRKAAYVDAATGVWNRQKLDSYIEDLLQQDEPFSIVLVCVRNLKRLDQRYPASVIGSALKALLERLTELIGEEAALGRWDDESFVSVLKVPASAAITISREAAERLSSNYSVQENGVAETVHLQVITGTVERATGGDAAAFRQKLLQMSDALASA